MANELGEAFRSMCDKAGIGVRDIYWTTGRYDIVVILEAPDDVTMGAVLYSEGSLGNVRTETLRAFTAQETSQALVTLA